MNHIKNTQLMNLDFLRIVFTLIVIAYHFIRKLGIWNDGGYVIEKPITHYFNKSTQLIQTQKREINV